MSCILLTGASGVVGSALVPICLEDEAAELKLLLRAESPAQLEQRLDALRDFWQLAGAPQSSRIEALRGDIRLPHWGLERADYERLTREVTHVIHCAGDVHLNRPLDEARTTAVDSVQYGLELVDDACRYGRFQKFDVVSTVGVAGTTVGWVRERPQEPPGFHNTYEQAKWEAEGLLLAAIQRGLPATIHRPSMVVGDSRTGRNVSFNQIFYHLTSFLCGLRTEGRVPDTGGVRLDIIPADAVAHAIWLASRRPDAAGRILHLCSGPQGSWTLGCYSQRLREMLARRGRSLPPLQKMPLADFQSWAAVTAQDAAPAAQRFLRSLPHLLAYLGDEQLFDNDQTQRFLAPDGWELPSVDQYIGTVMEAFWSSDVFAERWKERV